jgi:hypothetical protein
MCGGHHEQHEQHEQRGQRRGGGFRGFGRTGFGRTGFPNREQLVERLQGYQQHLEHELQNTHDLLSRLGDEPQQPGVV